MASSNFSSRDWASLAHWADKEGNFTYARRAAWKAIETPIVSSQAAIVAIDILTRPDQASPIAHKKNLAVMSASSKVTHDVLALKWLGEVYFITGVTN